MFWEKPHRTDEELFWLMGLEQKLDIILSHLNLEYVPEKETTEPAKLVDKGKEFNNLFSMLLESDTTIKNPYITQPKKKKRGRPKKK